MSSLPAKDNPQILESANYRLKELYPVLPKLEWRKTRDQSVNRVGTIPASLASIEPSEPKIEDSVIREIAVTV